MALKDSAVSDLLLSKVARLAGVMFAFIAAACYTILDVLIYYLRNQLKPTLLFVWTSVVLLCCCIGFALVTRLTWRPLSFKHFVLVFLTGCFNWIAHVALVMAIFIIRPGNAVTLMFTMTIFTIIYNTVFFKARLRSTDLLFTTFSTIGVALISISLDQDDIAIRSFTPGYLRDISSVIGVLFAITCALTFAALFVIGRTLATKDYPTPPIVLTLSFAVQYTLVSIILCSVFNEWTLPDSWENFLMAMSPGLVDFVAIMFIFLALRYEESTNVSIVMTSEVIMTYAAQSVLFSFPLGWKTFVGTLFIVSSCIGVLLFSDRDDVNEERGQEGEPVDEDGDEGQPMLQ